MSEEKQDLEDYIQYNFDDIPSFKLALFLANGKIEVKVALGEVEENFLEGIRKASTSSTLGASVHIGEREFVRKSLESDKIYVAASESSSIFMQSVAENTFVVYCCGVSCDKDEHRIRELIHGLMA
ncbi:unnamed protein product [Caenorhabditis sp. 36 PRJEB53466]|nr:unnamed protein product [Caenorhabditis sp. 36 PRJEB53466]